ncbi:hypothetical protein JZ751_026761 [Albula glossodonta]|uniref:Uncharacterized protein n=1 Tax=Albula glossodonta TaxID=121402 RepID=A0A8T2PGW0_9TELE|nr:hypothetical protein JZ751_026761 [Albula glossodonta]
MDLQPFSQTPFLAACVHAQLSKEADEGKKVSPVGASRADGILVSSDLPAQSLEILTCSNAFTPRIRCLDSMLPCGAFGSSIISTLKRCTPAALEKRYERGVRPHTELVQLELALQCIFAHRSCAWDTACLGQKASRRSLRAQLECARGGLDDSRQGSPSGSALTSPSQLPFSPQLPTSPCLPLSPEKSSSDKRTHGRQVLNSGAAERGSEMDATAIEHIYRCLSV